MASRSISFSTATPSTTLEGDGCEQAENVCAQQQCLTRPRFFCGQLLTDQDLSALLEWTQNKRRLDRYKQGWGVVEGLQVVCDPSNRSQVIVRTGYAVDPCGNDIVVCESSSVDLSQACPIAQSSCTQFTGEQLEEMNRFLGMDLPPGEVSVVDLYLHYHERGQLPLPALGRGACSERDACEFSRVQEHYRFDWQYAPLAGNPFDEVLREWERNYFIECRRVVERYEAEFPRRSNEAQALIDLDKVKAWLHRWLDTHPLHEFCFVRDAIDLLPEPGEDNEIDGLARLLLWIVQDCRNEYLRQRPMPSAPSAGVPVARIWLHRKDAPSAQCRVIHVDDFPVPRQELSSDAWPAPDGEVNLGRYVWQRTEQVCAQLSDLGLEPVRVEIPVPQSIDDLKRFLEQYIGNVIFHLLWPMHCHDIETGQDNGIWKPDSIGIAELKDDMAPVGERVLGLFRVDDSRWAQAHKHLSAVRGKREAPLKATPNKEVVAKEPASKETTPVVSAQSNADVDLLATINGIGEKRAFKLVQSGIVTFEDLAVAELQTLRGLFPRGVKDEEFEGWIRQAKRLSK